MGVHLDAAHVVMRRRGHRDRLRHGINACSEAIPGDGGVVGEDARTEGGAGVEKNLPARLDLAVVGPRHDVPGRQFGILVDGGHEALTQVVDQDGALAAERFGGERGGIGASRDGGGVKLHEFRVGDDRPGAGGHAHCVAADARRIGGDRIEPAQAARGQHGGAGPNQHRLAVAVAELAGIDADDAALFRRQIHRRQPLHHADGRGAAHLGDKGLHDGEAGPVAVHPDDATVRVRGLAAEQEMSRKVPIEGRAPAREIIDARRRLRGHRLGDCLVDDAGTGNLGIDRVSVRAVAIAYCSRDAALGPGRRSAVTERLGRQHGHRPRRQLQGAEETGQSCSDDQSAVGIQDVVVRWHAAPFVAAQVFTRWEVYV